MVKTAQHTDGKLESIMDKLAQITQDGKHVQAMIKSATDTIEFTDDQRSRSGAGEVTMKSNTDMLKDRMVEDSQQIDLKIKTVIGALERRLAEESQRVDAKMESLLGTSVKRMLERVEGKVQSLTDAINTLQQSLAARTETPAGLLPGQEGYLEAHCPSPFGVDQGSYEQSLHRAAWYYLYHAAWFESPDVRPNADLNAFENTMEKFPELDRQHLERALAHMCTAKGSTTQTRRI